MTLPAHFETPPTSRRGRRWTARLALVLMPVASLVAALTVLAQPASANPAGPDDPFGKIEKVTADPDGAVHFVGWALDPDSTGNAHVYGLLDGKWVSTAVTSIARSAVSNKYHTGTTPGFELSVAVPTTDVHTVCVAVRNVGPGIGRILKCVATPLGTKLTAQRLLAHSPIGLVSSASIGASSIMRVSGWASEPDYLTRRMTVVLYVDGLPAETVITRTASAGQKRAGAGKLGAFRMSVPVSSGSHLGCVWVVNEGFGANTGLGCTALDTRGGPATGTIMTPPINVKAVKEAIRHIGQPYVWGAVGPKKFDCSGLVLYSYHKAGLTTPRIAAAQFAAARLIPVARAVPGDLVFYHDSVGSVFHVGMYLAPDDTVAAIDPEEGVAHQSIWAPSATYGSFTHT